MTTRREVWASDTAPSMPEAPSDEQPVMVDFGGFAFTTGGITHAITPEQIDELSIPFFGPSGDL